MLVEPVQSRRPDFQPVRVPARAARITEKAGCAFIFDEVITGFRVHPGGAQALLRHQADLATYGKVVGGGLPIGVIAGKRAYMDALDGGAWQFGDDSVPTVGVTYFAGTFVRHPLALAAAKAALEHLKEQGPALQEQLNAKTERAGDAAQRVLPRGRGADQDQALRLALEGVPYSRITRAGSAVRDAARAAASTSSTTSPAS